MTEFSLQILGCGSALPTVRHNASAQIVDIHGKLFLVDCGEGTQLQMRRQHTAFARLNHIFISHLHGDHCFGLIGLISTLSMLGRGHAATLHIHAFPELESLLRPQLDYFCRDMAYDVQFHPFQPGRSEVIYDDRTVTVTTVPLQHRVPSSGFVFREKPMPAHLRRDMLDYYEIPICYRDRIKRGADYVMPDTGEVIANCLLTTPAAPPRSYAYLCDTAPVESCVPLIEGVDVLYHDCTFATADAQRAQATCHSTAAQAAAIAAAAHVGQLVLGHFSARYDDETVLLREAQDIFPRTLLAHEGLVVPVEKF